MAKSEFLLIKSSEEQLLTDEAGSPVDTAYVTERDGLPILRAVFDVRHFRPDEVRPIARLVFRVHCAKPYFSRSGR